MDKEQRLAYINAQILLYRIELEAILVANAEAHRNYNGPVFGPEYIEAFRVRAEAVIGHNAVISYLTNC
jgi:hypothetical protein